MGCRILTHHEESLAAHNRHAGHPLESEIAQLLHSRAGATLALVGEDDNSEKTVIAVMQAIQTVLTLYKT